jgi:hypothetical protein
MRIGRVAYGNFAVGEKWPVPVDRRRYTGSSLYTL